MVGACVPGVLAGIAPPAGGWQRAPVTAESSHPFGRSGAWLTPSALALLLANLAPLAGVFFFKWDVFPLILLFWLENLVVGGFNVLKLLGCRASGPANWVQKVFLTGFFCVHYGMFCFVHGVFVFALFGRGHQGSGFGLSVSGLLDTVWHLHLGWALTALVVSHGISFALNYVRAGEYRRAEMATLMSQPYARIMVLHVTLLISGFILVGLGSPVVGLVLLVAFKTALDLRAHRRERRKFGARNQPAAPADAAFF